MPGFLLRWAALAAYCALIVVWLRLPDITTPSTCFAGVQEAIRYASRVAALFSPAVAALVLFWAIGFHRSRVTQAERALSVALVTVTACAVLPLSLVIGLSQLLVGVGVVFATC